jgi:uncharacterized protein YuzE
MVETQITIEYDARADAAFLRLGRSESGAEAHSVVIAPPGLPAAQTAEPDDPTICLRLGFDRDGRLHGIEFLMPREQLPADVLRRLGVQT